MTALLSDIPLPMVSRIRALVAACEWLDAQVSPTKHFDEAAAAVTAEVCSLSGPAARPLAGKSMQRLWYQWQNGTATAKPHTWQTLQDRRTSAGKVSTARTKTPAFVQHLHLLAARNKRGIMGAIRDLYAEWHEARTIPGYEGCNYQRNMPLPSGWSEDNLRKLMPDKLALMVLHEGTGAAKLRSLAQVFGTRRGGYPCELVEFDDVWLDCLVSGYGADGRTQVGRPLQLGCVDVFTGRRLAWGTKLRSVDDSGHHVQLKEDEMLYILCAYLYDVGYSPRGTRLVVEHGTAAVSAEVETALTRITHGLVKVERSTFIGKRQVGAFDGQGKGNPHFKAHVEQWHSTLHNYMGNALTQVGTDRRPPEMLAGIVKAEQSIIKAADKLPTADAMMLMPYIPTLAELCDKLARVISAINNRTDHALEGWEECGFTRAEFSLNGTDGWTPMDNLTPDVQLLAARITAANPSLIRTRRMSPQEAWEQETARPENKLIRLTAAECVELMGAHRKFKLNKSHGGQIALNSKTRYHQQLRYSDRIVTARGEYMQLAESGTYYGIFNPFAADSLFVLDERDRLLGVAARVDAVPYADEAAKLRAWGEVNARNAAELARIGNMQLADTTAAEIRQSYNKAVMRHEPVEPLAIADRRRLAAPPRRLTPPVLAIPSDNDLPDNY